MATASEKGSKDTPPQTFAQVNPPAAFDQLAVMQSLIEVSGDLKALIAKSDRLHSDYQELKSEIRSELSTLRTSVGSLDKKVGRAEISLIVAAVLLAAFAGLLWWLFSAPMTYLRDQMIPQQPTLTAPADSSQPTPD